MGLDLRGDRDDVAVMRDLVDPLDSLLLVEAHIEDAVLVNPVGHILPDPRLYIRPQLREEGAVFLLLGEAGLKDEHGLSVLAFGDILRETVGPYQFRHGLLEKLLSLGRVAERLNPHPMERRRQSHPSLLTGIRAKSSSILPVETTTTFLPMSLRATPESSPMTEKNLCFTPLMFQDP